MDEALSTISDDQQRATIRAQILQAASPTATQDPPDQSTTMPPSSNTAGRQPKWSLRTNFVKRDLDISSMRGHEFQAWFRQFSGFLTEAGFWESSVSFAQRLLAVEQCVTASSYNCISAIRLSLPSVDQNDLKAILAALESSCRADTNLWSARKIFRQRTQHEGESYRDTRCISVLVWFTFLRRVQVDCY